MADFDQRYTPPLVITPTGSIDPRTALATSMHANPGVYAFLIGSGMSSAAGVRTGWGIVQDLVMRIAKANGVDLDAMNISPSEWWTTHSGAPLAYNRLLEELGSTPAARQAILRGYFDPAEGDPDTRVPTAAHRALAWLCSEGYVRVILTTNFDRLIEHALVEQGVIPQVVDTSHGVQSMIPLVHSRATILKIHGDYLSANLRNTTDELANYSAPWRRVLRQIFEEYGLVVIGWSAQHDSALARMVMNVRDRRYPMYWAARAGRMLTGARQLVEQRQAHVISIGDADEFMVDVQGQIARLAQAAERRRDFSIYRHPINYPNQSAGSFPGDVCPLLTVRTYAMIEVGSYDEVGIIGPETREQIVQTLDACSIVGGLNELVDGFTPVEAVTGAPAYGPLERQWVLTPQYQSLDRAYYRWGGSTDSGISALCSVQLSPSAPPGGISLTLDVGVSVAERLAPGTLALLVRDGLLLVAGDLPAALGDLLPADFVVERIEASFMATQFTGVGEPGQRHNDLIQRVNWESFGDSSGTFNIQAGFAIHPGSEMGLSAMGEAVVAGFNYMLLAHGFTDPRTGIAGMRSALDLPEGNH